MVDEVVTPTPVKVEEQSEIEKLHAKLKELEHKATPVIVKGYLAFKAFLSKYINKYPVYAAWVSGGVGAGFMFYGLKALVALKWFSF